MDTNCTGDCSNQYCHGSNLQGVQDSGPPCTKCHSIPYTASSLVCNACHGIPPDGTAFPNVSGRHAQHATSDTTTCSICHNGAGGMTTNSYHLDNVVEIFFETAYTAKSGGTPTYDGSSNTCKNVSCHGGQTTPSWLTGSIDVNTNCTMCHAYGTTQYNSYLSGHHSFHLTEVGANCTDCHDTNNLATVHFTNLSSTTMTTAYQTIKSTLHYTGTGGGTYGTCTLSCHGQDHQANQW